MNCKLSIEIAAQVGSRVICSLFGLALVTQLCRYLSLDDFGIYTLSFSVLTFFSPVVEIGMNAIAIREISRMPERNNTILSSIILIKLAISAISLLCAFFFVMWLGTETRQQTIMVLTSLGLFNLVLNSFDVWLIVRHRMIVWGVAQIFASLMGFLIVTLLIWLEQGLHAIVLAQVGSVGLAYFFVYARIRKEFRFCKPEAKMLVFLIRESLPQGIASMVSAFYFNIDMIMIAKILNTEEVAFYGAAYRLLNLMIFVPHAIMMSFMPMLTRALREGEIDFFPLFRYAFQLLIFVSIPIALWASWFAEEIIAWIYTDAYLSAAPVLILLMWAGVGVFASHLSGYTLVIINKQKVGMYLSTASLLLNTLLNMWMIPAWGIRGAAVSTLVTEFIVVVAGYALCFYYLKVLPFSSMLFRSLIVSTVVFLLLYLGGGNPVITTMIILLVLGASFFYFLREKETLIFQNYMDPK